MMGFAPFPVSSSRHQRSIFHRELLKSDSELMKWLRIRIESHWSLVSQDWNGASKHVIFFLDALASLRAMIEIN